MGADEQIESLVQLRNISKPVKLGNSLKLKICLQSKII